MGGIRQVQTDIEIISKIPVADDVKEKLKELSEIFEINYCVNDDYFVMRFDDGYEHVTAYVYFNEYGNIYMMQVSYFCYDDEVPTPESCHSCVEDCAFYKKGKCKLNPDKEILTHLRKEAILASKVKISADITEQRCHINVPHYHYYKSYFIEIRADNVNFGELLYNIDYFIDIYESSLIRRREMKK